MAVMALQLVVEVEGGVEVVRQERGNYVVYHYISLQTFLYYFILQDQLEEQQNTNITSLVTACYSPTAGVQNL